MDVALTLGRGQALLSCTEQLAQTAPRRFFCLPVHPVRARLCARELFAAVAAAREAAPSQLWKLCVCVWDPVQRPGMWGHVGLCERRIAVWQATEIAQALRGKLPA